MQGSVIQRTTAIGLARYAYEYIHAALTLDEATERAEELSHISTIPAYFLATHGVELTLKAFLLHSGVGIGELARKPYRHDLSHCLIAANDRGLIELFQLDENDKVAFDLLVKINAANQLRYIQIGSKQFPLWSIVEPLIVRLYEAVAKEVGWKKSFHRSYLATGKNA